MTRSWHLKIPAAILLLTALSLSAAGCRALAPAVKYPTTIDWQPYEAGLARAKAEGKPVMLILGADWCGPCHTFADNVLSDPRVIAKAVGFVVIHVNVDQREDLSKKHRLGGDKLPRTYFLSPDGVVLEAARRPSQCGRYGYDHTDPTSLLAGMDAALKLVRGTAAANGDAPLPADEGEVCSAKAGDTRCYTCLRQRCCAELIACTNDPACHCASYGPARAATLACAKERCADAECPAFQ
jgi:thiol-disulfide isomerase/thioredoxin